MNLQPQINSMILKILRILRILICNIFMYIVKISIQFNFGVSRVHYQLIPSEELCELNCRIVKIYP